MEPIYEGNDLGVSYSENRTDFRLWAPAAEQVRICFYPDGSDSDPLEVREMKKDIDGTWTYVKSGDLHGVYYTYLVTNHGRIRETADPYAKAAGVNGSRSMVVDLKRTNPQGFKKDRGPKVSKNTDIVVYEVSIADTTADASSGAQNAGKYLGLTERGTQNADGLATGLDHILELGVTHVQIMPFYDFGSIDEANLQSEQYNWGYDPVNYNVPEGSYSTDPFHGEVRIQELKQMIQTFHQNGIGVIMDVVYNHTYDVDGSCLQKCVPDYYYRKDENGYSNGSGCGNELASERSMVSKYIIDSLKYWAKEYHIDGFRFDLMGCLDIATMEKAAQELKAINPSIILYGEGWMGGSSLLDWRKAALKANVPHFEGVGAFSDDIRDAIKGSVFGHMDTGFVSGKDGLEHTIRYAVAGAVEHPQVDAICCGNRQPWAKTPSDVVNYVSCHDNLTLWDKLCISRPDTTEEERLAMNRLAAAIVFTSQGIPFFLSGEEFARSKPIEGTDEVSENSYNLPLFTNSLKYDRLTEYKDLYAYYKGLIAFRKAHKGLRFATAKEVQTSLYFINNLPANVVAFTITTKEETLFVVYNANSVEMSIPLPESAEWKVYIEGDKASSDVLHTLEKGAKEIAVEGVSCVVLGR